MKASLIPQYSIKDWVPGADQFVVVGLDTRAQAPPVREPFRNDFYTVYWLKVPNFRLEVDAVTYTTEGHTLLFVAPGQVCRFPDGLPGSGCFLAWNEEYYCLKEESTNRGIHSLLFFNPDYCTGLTLDTGEEGSLADIVRMMVEEFEGRKEDFGGAFFSLLKLFLIRASRIMETKERSMIKAGDTPFRRFLLLIQQHYKEKKNVSEYADLLHLTPVCLNALSKDMSGLTAGEQIRGHIIIEAKRLLHNTSMNVKSIAYELGFEDAAYFSRFFKKYTGRTLLEFRAQRKVPN